MGRRRFRDRDRTGTVIDPLGGGWVSARYSPIDGPQAENWRALRRRPNGGRIADPTTWVWGYVPVKGRC